MSASDACPCGGSLKYKACCAPYHRGEREPEDAPRLMRARFAAFAQKSYPFLAATLHPSHPDAQKPKEALLRELRDTAQRYRYVRLHVLDSEGPDARGVARVLFHAEVFEQGKDRSFVELSEFERAPAPSGPWRYARGDLLSAQALPPPKLATLKIPAFLEALRASA